MEVANSTKDVDLQAKKEMPGNMDFIGEESNIGAPKKDLLVSSTGIPSLGGSKRGIDGSNGKAKEISPF